MDLEMTGLDVEKDVILEIATVITDLELNLVGEGPVLAIQHPEEKLERMDDWNRTHHQSSGLWQRVVESEVCMEEAEAVTLEFISGHVDKHQSPLCGNSIWQDRRFLARHMPTIERYLHYRVIDVSTVKELARYWAPDTYRRVKKTGSHRALDDILESVEELRLYRDHLLKL